MPNHITNIVKFKGDKKQIELLIKHVETINDEEDFLGKKTGNKFTRHFDFNKIIPMPESLNITSGSETDRGIALADANSDEAKRMIGYNWKDDAGNVVNTYKQLVEYIKNSYPKTAEGKKRYAEMVKLGQQAVENKKKYGCATWYDWAYANWGTK